MSNKLNLLLNQTDDGRKILIEKLISKKWFIKSSFEVQQTLIKLPRSFDGLLRELSIKPEQINNWSIVLMTNILISKSMSIISFKLRSSLTNEIVEQEYFCYMSGNNPNCRGIILIESENGIKYFICKKSIDFAVSETIIGSINSYYPQFSNSKLISLPSKFETQLGKILNQSKINIKRYIDLGGIYTDSLMTNNFTLLYAGVITAVIDANTIRQTNDLILEPIEKIKEYINESNDSYFLAIISRLINLSLIKLTKNE